MRKGSLLIAISLLLPAVGYAEPLKVGAIYGLTGPLSSFGGEYRNSAVLAQEASGGTVSVAFEDSGWDPKTALTAFLSLAHRQHIKVFHVMGAGMSMAIKPVSERQNLLLFSAAAHPELLSGSTNVIRHSNDAANDARILADALMKTAAKKIASLYVDNEWGVFFNARLTQALSRDREIQFFADGYHPSETDFRSRLLALTKDSPDIFVVNSFGAAAGTIIKELRQLGYKNPVYANNGIVLSQDSFAALGSTPVADLYVQDYPELPAEYCQLYFSRFGKVPGYLALAGYTDIELLGFANSKVGSAPDAIARFVRGLEKFEGKYLQLKIDGSGDITVNTRIMKLTQEEYNNRMHPNCQAVARQSGDS
jgi:branched-chain amino acid transport system substrate-binding protein